MRTLTKFLTLLALLLTTATGTWAETIDLSGVTANKTAQDGDVLTGTLSAIVKISIADGATVTLRDVTIIGSSNSNYKWAAINCEGDATIILKGTNTLKGFYEDYPGIHIVSDKTLTVKGNGLLDASSNGYGAGIGGGYNVNYGNIVIEGGIITATGGTSAAGIGGGYNSGGGDITITDDVTSVKVTKGNNGPCCIGKGTGNSWCGTVTIGGTVYSGGITTSPYTYTGATKAITLSDTEDNSATLEEYDGRKADVTLSGRTLYKDGAWNTLCLPFSVDISDSPLNGAIAKTLTSTDYDASTSTLTLAFGKAVSTLEAGKPYLIKWEDAVKNTVNLSTLTTDNYEAQDGDMLIGTLDSNVKITVADGATVTLCDATINGTNSGDYKWAGITCTGDATLILSGENTVRGFHDQYSGIFIASGKTLTIRGDGSLNASSNGWAAGIGASYQTVCGNIRIESGTITATAGWSAAGIGGAYDSKCGDITITGGTVNATGGYGGAGIGSGAAAGYGSKNDGSCGNITITGGTVNAAGGISAPGIGGGMAGSCGDITITNTVTSVTATAGNTGATYSIGMGANNSSFKSTCGTITIGGTVYYDGSSFQNDGDTYLATSPLTYNGTSSASAPRRAASGDIVNPVFEGVTITSATADVETEYIDFKGSFSPVSISGEDKTMLYMGADNKLYYPNGEMQIGSCRAYFKLKGELTAGDLGSGAPISNFVLNFDGETGNGQTTGIATTNRANAANSDSAWYTLDGRLLTGKPTQRGVYINKGKKIVIK